MVYNYTIPRRRTAALDASPGPAYSLPNLVGYRDHDPRSSHQKGPAFKFGIKHRGDEDDRCGPGPVYKPDPNVYRTGPERVPRAVMSARTQEPVWVSTPGPAEYSPERSTVRVKSAAPAYSFGSRYKMRDRNNMPAPNAYTMPGQLGRPSTQSNKKQSPSYSITGRSASFNSKYFLQHGTPGPSAYRAGDLNVWKPKSPCCSLASRTAIGGSEFQVPGPAAHYSEKVWSHKREPPRFSFGIRHSQHAYTMSVPDDLY